MWENILPIAREYCRVGSVNDLGGQLTHDGGDGQMTARQMVETLEISMEMRGWEEAGKERTGK